MNHNASAVEHQEIARDQLLLWVKGAAAVATAREEEREESFYAWLQGHDEHYRNMAQLPDDIRARDATFSVIPIGEWRSMLREQLEKVWH